MTKNNEQIITVDGQYQPNVVEFNQGEVANLTFKRVSDRGCLGAVQSHDLAFSADLPLNEAVTFEIPTDQSGEFEFACGMDMVKGKIVIK
ncbi:cupredoxin domain-containing protein [Fructobacillus ficulneus]|uniref:EfeO-type cupredoxin-like domain-containing protein n=1 Tax=Fructobacillus ficulneus TaxID=157463 RepID=A0A0K8MJG8_9LACO|nr:hypothetical protein FFIC_283460 [Fructobacillus ficulneus]